MVGAFTLGLTNTGQMACRSFSPRFSVELKRNQEVNQHFGTPKANLGLPRARLLGTEQLVFQSHHLPGAVQGWVPPRAASDTSLFVLRGL